MIYRVFLDTNIYEAANYSFRNAQFTRLISLSKVGHLSIVVNPVIEGEVRSHIKEQVNQAVNELNATIKNRAFAGFRNIPEYKEKLTKNDATDWIRFALNEFSDFLSSCSVRRIPLNGIDIESVMNDYFQQNLPFEPKKPEEFKDAIAIKSLVLDMKKAWDDPDLIQYCVISNDKGFTKAVTNAISGSEIEDYTLIFCNLTEFTDYLAVMDKQMQFMLRYLQSSYGKDILHDVVKEALEGASYEIEDNGEIVDQEVVDVDILSIEPHAVSLTNTGGTPNVLDTIIEGEADISVDYTFIDDDESFYDKETRSYLYVVSKSIAATHKIKFNISASFIVNECLAEEEEIESEDESVFESKNMEIDVYSEQAFELTGDTLVSYNIIEASDDGVYDTCPDCGRRIGIENDGGNSFCFECAPNH